MIKIEAFQVAEQINIKKFRSEFAVKPVSGSLWELFYVMDGKYLYVLNYGVVVFADYQPLEKSDLLRFIKPFLEVPLELEFSEDFRVDIDKTATKPQFKHNSVTFPQVSDEVVRITMLNIAQSVALDYYEFLTYNVISDTNKYTQQLEHYGQVRISKKALLKFIGRTLNVKNSIVDNLYILDDPNTVWEDEYLEQVNKGLKEIFDIQMRFRDLDYKLKIVQDNLNIFADLMQHRESSRLEWIIIGLILIEVINLIWTEVLNK